jgi:putative transcriptional regulator
MMAVKSRLQILMAEKKIKNIRHLERELEGKLSYPTLYRLYNDQGDRIEFKTIGILCRFFNCAVGDLLEYVEKEQ